MDEKFNLFLQETDEKFHNFAILLDIHENLLSKGCECETTVQKSGYMVSYITKQKRKLANIVTRKTGVKIRIYADHVQKYQEILNGFPVKMKKEMQKSPICKRLVNPDDCNPKCSMGYSFEIDGEYMQKCRFSAFMPTINAENETYIIHLLNEELACCQ